MSKPKPRTRRATGAAPPAEPAPKPRATTRRGRARRAAILAAASEVFLESGFEGASVDAIVARAGGSKRTIYEEFGNKEGLFAAIVTENVLQAMDLPVVPGATEGEDLHATLAAFGAQYTGILMRPEVLALFRAVVHESPRFPDLARIFWDNGPAAVVERLTAILEVYRRRGEIRVDDCRHAADVFVGMVRGNWHLATVLGLRPRPRPGENGALIATMVDIFLDGLRTRA